MLCEDMAADSRDLKNGQCPVRAHVHYMPQLQLIRELIFILIRSAG